MKVRAKAVVVLILALVTCLGLVAWAVQDSQRVRAWRARKDVPRVILVTFDTLNVWYTSLYSDDSAATPNVQALADSGVLFEQARTVVPQTLPSHASLLSGRMPWNMGVMVNGDVVPDDLVTLPEILSEHGYRTAAFLSLGVLNPSFNLDQGFDEYDPVPTRELRRWYRTADEVTNAALGWMNDHADEPFFVWIHISDPHKPYVGKQEPPDTELLLDDQRLGLYALARYERYPVTFELPPGDHRLEWRALHNSPDEPVRVLEMVGSFELGLYTKDDLPDDPTEWELRPAWGVDLVNPQPAAASVTLTFGGRTVGEPSTWVHPRYREQVAYADQYLGEIREWVTAQHFADDTLWIVASDHGEGLGHEGRYGHAAFTHEEQLRTLLLFSGPKVPEKRRLRAPPVLLTDTLPTILALLALDEPEGIDGRSLVDCWSALGCRPPRSTWPAYGADKEDQIRSSSLYRWPLKANWTRHGRSAFFDLSQDPREIDPVQPLPETLAVLREFRSSLSPEHSAMAESLTRQIEALGALIKASKDRELDAQQQEMLRSLGYL